MRSRAERAEATVVLIALSAILLTVMSTVLTLTGVTLSDIDAIKHCQGVASASSAKLERRYGKLGDAPADDPDVVAIKDCKAQLDTIVSRASSETADAQNLRTAVQKTLADLGGCRITAVSPGAATAGITHSLTAYAYVPLSAGTVSGTIDATVNGTALSSSLAAPLSGFTTFGTVTVPDEVARSAAGTVSEVTVSAHGSFPASNGRCPGFLQPDDGGQCAFSCTTPVRNVVWQSPPVPTIKLFKAIPSTVIRGQALPIFILWNVGNASAVTIDQGIGEVGDSGSWLDVSPDQDTTYTLSAQGVRLEDTQTATAIVKVQEPTTIVLSSPADKSTVTDDSVVVSGTVAPVPPGATVAISMNGTPTLSAPVDGAGSFSVSVPLAKKATLLDLTYSNPNLSITTCGPRSTDVTVGNGKSLADVTNLIGVGVPGANPPITASATVYHAVRITGFRVTWTDCPPLNKDESRDVVLTAGQTVTVGTVNCGVRDPGGFSATCSVTASIDTSVGGLDPEAIWSFNVPSPCP